MKKLSLSFTLIFLCCYLHSSEQNAKSTSLYMPLNLTKAYNNGTRSFEGKPTAKFWQNTCDYKIDAEVNPFEKTIKGHEAITYFNNSPDTLSVIFMHTYQDVYKKHSARAYEFDKETSGVDIILLKVNGDTIPGNNYYHSSTLFAFRLKKPLPPADSCNLEILWSSEIVDEVVAREGYTDSTSAFIGLWYPKISVFDDLFGWDRSVYDLGTEFYSPLANYSVSIKIPKGFLIWATGELQNKDIYPLDILEKIDKVNNSYNVISVIDSNTVINPDSFKSDTWNFIADSVPDFAFAFSDHYLWDAGRVRIGNKDVRVNTAYSKGTCSRLKNVTSLIKKIIGLYSFNDPEITYPYSAFTSFQRSGGGGMEFPMMSYDGTDYDDSIFANYVFIHECLHSWSPFYLRTNETKFAWLDEGITDFYSFKLLKDINIADSTINKIKSEFSNAAATGVGNLPMFTPTEYLTWFNNSLMSYSKPVKMLTALEDMLGEAQFKSCFKAFFNTWKYKSPCTYDFIFFVNNYTHKNLNWFWDAWFMHFGYPDLSIKSVGQKNVVLQNTGLLPIPFTLKLINENGEEKEMKYHADAWKNENPLKIDINTSKLKKIEIKCELVPDYNLKDNSWEAQNHN